ncbi:MAG: T9SS type A sorting domain-containing protein [Bacteroidota bacterium]
MKSAFIFVLLQKIYLMRLLAILLFVFINFHHGYSQQEIKLLPGDGASGDEFGSAVSIWNDACIVGSYLNNDVAFGCGTAYVYRKNGSTWTEEQKLAASDPNLDDNFGVSVDIYNNIAIVGANLDDGSGSNRGAAYIFRFNGTTWVQEQKLIASDAEDGDQFGTSVAIFDTVAVVGSYGDDVGGLNTGSVYVYHYDGTGWNPVQKLNGTFPAQDDFFGYTVDVYAGRIAAGVYLDDDSGINSGSAYIFSYNGTSWVIEQKLNPTNGTAGDSFGFSVSLKDTLCAIGAYGKNGAATATGAVYVFKRNGTVWTQQQMLTAPDGQQDDWLGFACAIEGKTLVGGAFHDDDMGLESGAFYVWRYNGTNWIYEFKKSASDGNTTDEFGQVLSVYNLDVICGAPKNDDNGSNSGSAYIHPLCTYTPVQEICLGTVNTNFSENLLIWQKPVTTFIDSFFIYRYDGLSEIKITSVPYSSNSHYIDNAVNLVSGTYHYRLTTENICGNESSFGQTHKIIHLTSSIIAPGQAQLTWTEAAGFSFPYYRVWRDTTGTGSYQLMFATLNTQFSWVDNALPQTTNVNYYIEVLKSSSCSSGTYTRSNSVSNLSNPYTVSVNEIPQDFSFTVFPNPAGENAQVIIHSQVEEAWQISVTDARGRLMYSENKKGNRFSIPLSGFAPGIYCITVKNNRSSFVQRLSVYR